MQLPDKSKNNRFGMNEMNKKRNLKKIIIYGILTLLIMVMIFLFSCQNGEESTDMSNSFLITLIGQVLEQILPPLTGRGFDADIREYAHMFEYWCLGISMSLLLREIIIKWRPLAYILAELGSFLYACTDEFHQTFVPDRVGTIADVGVDAVGFTIGVILIAIAEGILFIIQKKRGKKE